MRINRLTILIILLLNGSLLKSQETIVVDIEAAYKKGIELMNANQYSEAVNHIFECHRSDYNNQDYLNRLAYCYFKLGNYRESKYAYAALLKMDSLNIGALSNLAMIAELELNYKSASDYYGQLIQLDSTNSYYYRQNGLIAQKRGELIPATAFFNKAHILNEKNIATIVDLATAYLELGAVEYAKNIIDRGMQQDSANISVLYTNARIQNALDDYPGVIRSIERTMELGDSSNYLAMMIGVAYLRTDSLNQCIFHLNKIIEREKDSEHTHHYLALAYELQEDFEKAKTHFEKAIEKGISSKVPRYHEDLAKLYEKSNDYYKAYENYKAAYDYEAADELLFHIAYNADQYYKDKNIALRFYKKYLSTSDQKYQEYTNKRIVQLKEIIHQMKN